MTSKYAQDPKRRFAVEVVRTLRAREHIAYFAGGCVRDELMGMMPKDYDVATDAQPDEIRKIFGPRRTIPVGAAFGVITVLGPKPAGQIDVATFRSDESYSDGRRPDRVSFTTPENDALRRDFTINGLFFDPLVETVIDYVGGRQDIESKLVRAIGSPRERFREDKLRLLRAIRFSAALDFALDPATEKAIREMAPEVTTVSAERIAAELKRMLVDLRRARAVALLHDTGLLAAILPEVAARFTSESGYRDQTLAFLHALSTPDFPTALSALLLESATPDAIDRIARRFKLANDERHELSWLVTHFGLLWEADSMPWPRLQRILIHPHSRRLLDLHLAAAQALGQSGERLEYCRERLAWPEEKLNPPPLITGDDLISLGLPPGEIYGEMLEAVRDAQLAGQVASRAEALNWAREFLARRKLAD
jgi:tRNA nucleotidyltransferase/poly(A) polymerase